LERGTNALLIGVGRGGQVLARSDLCHRAAERGEHAVFFAFDEGPRHRGGARPDPGAAAAGASRLGLIRFQQIDPAEMSPGEFAANVRQSVEEDGARVVIIDSLNGY
jgi:circadian clock protein KaiC